MKQYQYLVVMQKNGLQLRNKPLHFQDGEQMQTSVMTPRKDIESFTL